VIVDAEAVASVRLLTIPEDVAGQRLDNFLLSQLKGAPRTLIYRIVRTGEVRVNKGRTKQDYRLQAGDVVRVPPLRLA
jgi:23S rRNA pseudouridine955/2504/2580 synthase